MPLTRRTLLVASLSTLGGSAQSAPRQTITGSTDRTTSAANNVRHIMPSGAGSRNGDGWANAATILQLNAMIAAVGPGGIVYVRADAGPYPFTANRVGINQGGRSGAPVSIIGVDQALTPKHATFVGTRTAWTLPADPEEVTNVGNWTVGGDFLLLRTGADHLVFRFLDFQRAGQAFRLTAPTHTGITVADCSAYNVQRFFEHDPKTSHVDTVLRNITVTGFSKTAIRIRGDSHDVILEDVNLNSGRQDGANFATGVECNETAHDILMRRVTAANCHDSHYSDPNRFWNADGFASERGNYNIRREHCTSSGNTDAGYDDKGTNVTHVNCTASGNKVNYKFWGPSTTNIDCQAINPKSRGGVGAQMQYYVYGGTPDTLGADVLIRGGLISDNDPDTYIFVTDAYNNVFRIAGPTITKHPRAVMQTELEGWGNAFLHGSTSDTAAPTITSAASLTAARNMNFAHILRASRPVTWSIVGGPEAASFRVLPDRRAGALTMVADAATERRRVTVRARDVNGNSSEQAITVTVGTNPTAFFRDDFQRPDQELGASIDWSFAPDGGGDGSPGDVVIRDKKLAILSAANGGAAYVSPDCGFADHYAQATIAQVPTDHSGIIACRLTNPSNLIGVEFKNDGIALYERAKGEFRELGFVTMVPRVGDVIRLEVKGVNATVKRNGVVVIGPKPTDGTNAPWTRSGVLSRSLAVIPWIDDYEAGPL